MQSSRKLNIAICNDHAGYELKLTICDFLEDIGVNKLKDFGSHNTASCDYADYAHPMAEAIQSGEFDFGISICGSGNGISMTLNKHADIRAALCWNKDIAILARQHNNANVISLPARFVDIHNALEILDAFLTTNFEGGRHQLRIDKINLK